MRLEEFCAASEGVRTWLDSLLVVLDGELVFERYFHGVRSQDQSNVYSITKSWLSCLVGIALQRGLLKTIDMPLVEVLADRVPAGFDLRKADITIRHCLLMQSGLRYENTFEFATQFGRATDPVAFFFSDNLPVCRPPGTAWLYSGADSQMVAEVLRVCAGEPLAEFARQWLAEPLGIGEFRWPRNLPVPGAATWPAEIGASELCLTPIDLARFGECVRRNGLGPDRQVVPASWIELATAATEGVDLAYLDAFYASLGLPPLRRDAASYGLHIPLMWLDGRRVISLAGSGGQYVFVVPELALTVVQTANLADPATFVEGIQGGVDIMLDVILPAFRS